MSDYYCEKHNHPEPCQECRRKPTLSPARGSVASPYTVKQRDTDGVWCIYLRRYNCVIAEFGKGTAMDAKTIKAILDGTQEPQNEQAQRPHD